MHYEFISARCDLLQIRTHYMMLTFRPRFWLEATKKVIYFLMESLHISMFKYSSFVFCFKEFATDIKLIFTGFYFIKSGEYRKVFPVS